MKKKDSKHRKFFITQNNWTAGEYDVMESLMKDTEYALLCKEIGKKEETPHLHLWLHYKNPRHWRKIQKLCPKACVEEGKGSDTDQNYLKKDGDFIESGTIQIEEGQGHRTDIESVRIAVVDGENLRDIAAWATSYQSLRSAELLLKLFEKGRNWEPEIYWYHGSTGSGKTREAAEKCDDPWWSGKNLRWWEGYDGHEDVIIDDFRKDFCTFHELIRLTDRYPYRIETKGGSRQLLAKRIFITCPWHWEDLWEGHTEDKKQLGRRIMETKLFGTRVVEQRSGVIIDPDPMYEYESCRSVMGAWP